MKKLDYFPPQFYTFILFLVSWSIAYVVDTSNGILGELADYTDIVAVLFWLMPFITMVAMWIVKKLIK
jgi:hypothetical protein